MNSKLLVFTATLAAAWLPCTGTAFATHVSCGDTITTDTTLDSDLSNCPGDGVVIAADNITLDLDGHLIDGSGQSSGYGVNNEGGHDGVTVTRGEIRDFPGTIKLESATGNRIYRITGDGFYWLKNSSDNSVDGNSALGLLLEDDSDRNRVERNSLSRTISIIGDTFGLVDTADDNVIERNVIRGGGGALAEFAAGISLRLARRTTIVRNDISTGAVLTGPMVVSESLFTAVERNRLRGGDFGIVVGGFSRETTLLKNDVARAVFDGISIVNSSNTLLDGNTSIDNGDDGIDVGPLCPLIFCPPPTSVTLTKNTANFNADLGIEAIPGVIDGGGNKARGNGNQAQCTGVSCS